MPQIYDGYLCLREFQLWSLKLINDFLIIIIYVKDITIYTHPYRDIYRYSQIMNMEYLNKTLFNIYTLSVRKITIQ